MCITATGVLLQSFMTEIVNWEIKASKYFPTK